jgi:ADP-ribose pyrophosphatase
MDCLLHAGRFLHLIDRDGWEFVSRPNSSGIVIIVAVTDGKLILVEQLRRSVNCQVIGLPAGLVDTTDSHSQQESESEAAIRELEEETGYTAASVREMARGPISPGATDEVMAIFVADGVTKKGAQRLDADEDIKVHLVDLAELTEWLKAREREGRMIDLKLFMGLSFVQPRPTR